MSATPPWWTAAPGRDSGYGQDPPAVGDCTPIAQTMADHIEGNLAEPDRNHGESLQVVASRVLTKGGFSRGVAESPPEARPEHAPAERQAELLSATVAAWEGLRARSQEIEECPARARHFALGYLTSAEWVRMCAVHNAHHLRIVLDMVGEEALEE